MTEHHIQLDRGEGVRLVCDLSVLAAAQRKRRFVLEQLLQVGTVDIVELPDGYAFLVDPVSIVAQYLEEFAVLERLCCPFVTIAVRAGKAGAQPVLEMRGGDAVKQFIAAEFGIRKRRTP